MPARWNHLESMPPEEIARALGCSENAVRMALKKAMIKLRDGRAEHLRRASAIVPHDEHRINYDAAQRRD